MMIENRAQLMVALQACAAPIQGFGVLRLGVFGSFARDTATAQSDVDLFVEFAADQKKLEELGGALAFSGGPLGAQGGLGDPGVAQPVHRQIHP